MTSVSGRSPNRICGRSAAACLQLRPIHEWLREVCGCRADLLRIGNAPAFWLFGLESPQALWQHRW